MNETAAVNQKITFQRIFGSVFKLILDLGLLPDYQILTENIWLLTILFFIFLLAGMVKGFLGIGLPTSAMALLTLVIEPTTAIALLSLSIITTNGAQYIRCESPRHVAKKYWLFGLCIIFSIFITSLFILNIPKSLLLLVIGLALIVFSITQMTQKRIPLSNSQVWHMVIGLGAGILGGMSSIWSPPVVMYLLNQNVKKEEFIGATGFLFFISSIPLTLGLALAGVLTVETTIHSFGLVFVVMTGFRIGEWMRFYVPQEMFRKILLWAFLLMGMRLVALSIV